MRTPRPAQPPPLHPPHEATRDLAAAPIQQDASVPWASHRSTHRDGAHDRAIRDSASAMVQPHLGRLRRVTKVARGGQGQCRESDEDEGADRERDQPSSTRGWHRRRDRLGRGVLEIEANVAGGLTTLPRLLLEAESQQPFDRWRHIRRQDRPVRIPLQDTRQARGALRCWDDSVRRLRFAFKSRRAFRIVGDGFR